MSIIVNSLFIYPVKSLSGIALKEATVEKRGLQWDRRWMIVDQKNDFITQRELPLMATIKTDVTQNGMLALSTRGDRIEVPLCANDLPREKVRVWDDIVQAIRVSDSVDEFLSDYLSVPCSLVYMPDDTQRSIDPDYATQEEIVSFADGFPILLANTASLDDLSRRVNNDIPMNRFRPNIVVESSEPFIEDTMGKFRLGGSVLEAVKHCARCPITTIDQETGQRTGKEPLRTLASFRRGTKGVVFAENLKVKQTGIIRIGDIIESLEPRGIYPRPAALGASRIELL